MLSRVTAKLELYGLEHEQFIHLTYWLVPVMEDSAPAQTQRIAACFHGFMDVVSLCRS